MVANLWFHLWICTNCRQNVEGLLHIQVYPTIIPSSLQTLELNHILMQESSGNKEEECNPRLAPTSCHSLPSCHECSCHVPTHTS